VAAPRTPTRAQESRRVELLTRSPEETRAIAAALATVAAAGDVLALSGGLGAGKTEFVKGLARGLGVTSLVTSPSFVLMAEHAGPVPLFHLDLYRLSGAIEALESGLADERRASGVTAIEWADRAAGTLPDHLAVRIDGSGDEPRRVAVAAATTRYARYIDALEGRDG
jgi:tRNA threonylcarbamoyladenosine biosynthesis protein TsaE